MQKIYEFLDIFEFSDELAQKDEKMQSELEKFDIAYDNVYLSFGIFGFSLMLLLFLVLSYLLLSIFAKRYKLINSLA